MLGSTWWATCQTNSEVANPVTAGNFRSCSIVPRGLARRRSKGRRDPVESDSGRTKKPSVTFTSANPAAAKKGARGPSVPSRPPTAGPTMKPLPNAAPTRPKFCARFSGGLTSAR